MEEEPRPGSEHLLIFPHHQVAEVVAGELRRDGFAHVRVLHAAAPTDPAGEWAVHVRDERLPDTAGGAAYEGLRERFLALVKEHDGWYDEPGDPRPPYG